MTRVPEQRRDFLDPERLHDSSAVEGVHFDGLFRNEWDTWAKTGRLDYKGLRTALPDVVEGLRNGKIDPQEFAECLTWQEMTKARMGIEKIPCIGFNGSDRTVFARVVPYIVLELLLFPDPPQAPSQQPTQAFDNLFLDMRQELVLAMSGTADRETLSRHAIGYRSWCVTDSDDFRETHYYAVWLYGFHRAWAKNKAAVEERIGKTLNQVPMMRENAPKRDFDKTMDNAFNEYVDRTSSEFKSFYQRLKHVQIKRELISAAALDIAEDRDVVREMCWECKTVGAKLFRCGGCKVAFFCCKEHQRKAWSRGHKNSCKLVDDVRMFVETNLKRIEKAVERDDIMGGGERLMKPCLEIDCLILRGLIATYVTARHDPMSSLLARFGPPSMENYYRNLADVVNGEECFVFPDTPNDAFKDSSKDGGISENEPVMAGRLSEGNPLVISIFPLARAIGFRPKSTEEGEKVVEDSNKELPFDATAEWILFRTARGFLNRYRSYYVDPNESRWKERKTEITTFMRDYVLGNIYHLKEKPPSASNCN